MDKECVKLCAAINLFDDIRTIESCCGHGEKPYRIWFRANNFKALPRILYFLDGCHSGYYDWKVIIKTDCGMSYPSLMIEGPIGAYDQAEHISKLLTSEFATPLP